MAAMPNGTVVLTRKFLEGAEEYLRYWPGPMTVLAEADATVSDNLDNIRFDVSQLPFKLKLVNFAELDGEAELTGAAIVLASAGHQQNHVASLCNRIGVPCVYVTEYSLRTRQQVVDAGTRNWLLRLRRRFWERGQERRQRAAIAVAQGVQCNGTPTFEAYRGVNSNALLFFDTRVTQEMLATSEEVDRRLAGCMSGRPLRLLFSGRLIAMKGADDLVLVAKHLKELGVAFELTICGDGELADRMKASIVAHDLSRQVRLAGVLDFHRELVPKVKHETDVFVCCHRQGDPSCTYLETMGCGVPIVGYDNEAFAGVVAASGSGWSVPMNQPRLLARRIQELDMDRLQIAQVSRKSLAFAAQHSFEATFRKRIEHLQSARAHQ
jgi:glycosyltransferase involved in cell wall biosynthesis